MTTIYKVMMYDGVEDMLMYSSSNKKKAEDFLARVLYPGDKLDEYQSFKIVKEVSDTKAQEMITWIVWVDADNEIESICAEPHDSNFNCLESDAYVIKAATYQDMVKKLIDLRGK